MLLIAKLMIIIELSMESLDKVEMDLGYADFRVVLIDLPLYADSTGCITYCAFEMLS